MSPFWKLQVCTQGGGKAAILPRKARGRALLISNPWHSLACSFITPLFASILTGSSPLGVPSVLASPNSPPLSLTKVPAIGLRAHTGPV